MINVMIVDDHSIIREGLSMTLSLCDDINVCGEASNGKEALDFLENNNVDVVLLDIRMPVMDGVEASKIIKERYDNVKILILTTFKEEEYIFEALKNGADGYMLKDAKSEEIIKGIKTVYAGNVLLQPEIASKVVKAFNNMMSSNHKKETHNRHEDRSDKTGRSDKKGRDGEKDKEIIKGRYESLTARETQIATLVAEGKSNKEISEILYITEGTVKNHLTKILGKLEVRDRTQLALYVKQYD